MTAVLSHSRNRRGLSMVEVVVSTMLVSMVLIGALQCVGAIVRARLVNTEKARYQHLAQQLLTEIQNQEYADPDLLPLFGPELLEPLAGAGPRSGWDDVDDYHNWTGFPPKDANGSTLPHLSGLRRSVTVEWVDPENPSVVSLTDQGLKRITVIIGRGRNGQVVARAIGLRSNQLEANGS